MKTIAFALLLAVPITYHCTKVISPDGKNIAWNGPDKKSCAIAYEQASKWIVISYDFHRQFESQNDAETYVETNMCSVDSK